jgi:hypothetical protein
VLSFKCFEVVLSLQTSASVKRNGEGSEPGMTTRPRMSAPIARVRIKTSERKRRATGARRWRPTDPPFEADARSHDQSASESSHPPFYPFPLDRGDDGEG